MVAQVDGQVAGKTFNHGGSGGAQSEHLEEYSNAAGGTVPIIGVGGAQAMQQAALPPIVMPAKKGGNNPNKHHHHHHKAKAALGSTNTSLAAFNSTKKQFPQLNKLNQHKKNSYVSPYSIKTISKP